MIYAYTTILDKQESGFDFAANLSGEDILRVRKFHNRKDQMRMILGRLLLSRSLCDLNINLSIKNIRYSSYGRPYLGTGIDFNISHSEDLVVCAVSSYETIGIDVEACKKIDYQDFQSCFNSIEWNAIVQSQDLKTFYSSWTKKEASIKANGKALSIPLTHVNIVNDDSVDVNGEIWNITSLDLHSDYICHLASKSQRPTIKIKNLDFKDLLS